MSRWDRSFDFTWPFPACWARVVPPTPIAAQTASAVIDSARLWKNPL